MFEKPKRKRGEKTWKLSLLLTATIILAAALYSFSNFGISQPKAYATEAWVDPITICSTAWYGININEGFVDAVTADVLSHNLPISLASIQQMGSMGRCTREGLYFSEVDLRFTVEAELYDDDVVLGNLVAEIVPIVAAHESQLIFHISVIQINFAEAEQQIHRSWRIDYFEAQRAIEAGLRGADLWLIGQ